MSLQASPAPQIPSRTRGLKHAHRAHAHRPGHNDICDAADPGDERRPCNGHSSGRNMWWDDGEMLLGPWDSDEWRDQEGHPQARAVCVGADAPLGAAA
eukprot:6099650-Prymnesium_polylepis.1